jgi:hypothetical protein
MRTKTKLTLTALVGLCLPLTLNAAGQFHFPVGISYAQGIYDAADAVFDLYEDAGYDVDDRFIIPVGLTISPYYEFPVGADMGLGVGVTVGPTAFIIVQEEYFGDYYYDDTSFSYIIPVGADLRYAFFRGGSVSPYIKVGFRYPIAGGDNVSGSEIGAYGAIGVELWRNHPIGMAIEVGYDSSKVTLEGPDGRERDETFAGFMVTVSAVF